MKAWIAAALAALCSGCGVSSWVVADESAYPISMSQGIRDADGTLVPAARKQKVGEFATDYKACSMLWRMVSLTGDHDISEDVNEQVKASGGDAITGLQVSSGGTVWTMMTLIGLLPDCSSVEIQGDIVKVAPTAAAQPVSAEAVPQT